MRTTIIIIEDIIKYYRCILRKIIELMLLTVINNKEKEKGRINNESCAVCVD